MRSVKKLLKKAMVFTLTAAMLVGTPLSVSAAPLSEVYQIEDGFGNVTGNEGISRTGTVTATDTNSGVLDANAELVGISLDETNLEFELPAKTAAEGRKELTATLKWNVANDKVDPKLQDKLLKALNWESSNTAVAAVEVPGGKYGTKENPTSRNKIFVNAKGAGTATITVTLQSREYGITYKAQATVTVVQYADKIWFDEEIDNEVYTGSSINLNDWVRTSPVKVSDQFTYTVVDNNKKKISKYNAKTNTLTFNKPAKDATGKEFIWIKAVGKKTSSDWKKITPLKGVNVNKIKFDEKKYEIVVNKDLKLKVSATMTPSEENGKITDTLSWSFKKPGIVEIVSADTKKPYKENKCTATLQAVSAGSTTITVQASSGKKASVNVKVSANLSTIEIEPAEATFYSGQEVDLSDMAKQYFGEKPGDKTNPQFRNTNLVKWTIVAPDEGSDALPLNEAKKAASINANGVLKVQPDLKLGDKESKKIAVQAVSKAKTKYFNKDKTDRPVAIESNKLIIDLQQISIDSITVTRRGHKGDDKILAQGVATDVKGGAKKWVNKKAATCLNKGVDKLAVGDKGVYNIVVKATDAKGKPMTLDGGTLVGWNASGNGKIVKSYKNAAQDGVLEAIKKGNSTVTISGAMKNPKNGKYAAVKTTFKANVTAPSKTLKLTVKNKGINVKGNKQTVTVTPVLEKGSSTNKSKDITYTVVNETKEKTIYQDKNGKVNGKIVLKAGDYSEGDVIKVTAEITNGPKTSIKLNVVAPTKTVQFSEAGKTDKVTKVVIDNDYNRKEMQTFIVNNDKAAKTPGKDNYATVDYTVNKPEVVMIRKEADGKLTIIPTANGTAKITATTLDGKKGTLTVQVKNMPENSFEEQNKAGICSVD